MIRLVNRVTYQRVVGESQSVYRAGKEDRVVEKMKIHNTDIAVVGIFLSGVGISGSILITASQNW